MALERICSIGGCGNVHLARGFCAKHYNATRSQRSKAVCSLDGCGRAVVAKGYCGNHARRLRRYGDPLAERKAPNGAGETWIAKNAEHAGDDCLIWPFSRCPNGYAKFMAGGKKHYASRVMCTQVHGDPPTPKHETAHSCGRGHDGCVNPRHLRWDTRTGNQADRLEHGTDIRGEKNVNAKLTEEDVRYIRRMRGVMLQAELAKTFMVDKSTVGKIQRRQWWSWLD